MKKVLVGLFFLSIFWLIFPGRALARIGVGVGTGKIQVDVDLKPGIIYRLPSLSVINTGDEPSDYAVSIAYHQDIPELRPKADWFIFTPQAFYLKPGEVKTVEIKLNLPLKMEPGDYFCYLEAKPVKKAVNGKTTIGVAAAAKLYFTVIPASQLQGIYYKIISFWKVYAPWPQRALLAVWIVILLVVFKKFFKLQVGFKKPQKENMSDSKKDE